MSLFTTKSIISTQTIGERLRKTREGLGISLVQVAHQLLIQRRYLESIESGQYSDLPGGVYGEEYIKTYARFLRMDAAVCVRSFKTERTYALMHRAVSMPLFLNARRVLFRVGSITAVRLAVALFGVMLAGYALAHVHSMLSAPVISLSAPAQYYVTGDPQVLIAGHTIRAHALTFNNVPILIDSNGDFRESVTLPFGLSVLTLTAQGRFGKDTVMRVFVRVAGDAPDVVVLQNAS